MYTPSNPHQPKSGKVFIGLILLLFGTILLFKQFGMLFPGWLFSWPVFLIALGLFLGFRHNFRNPSWFVLVIIGVLFFIERLIPSLDASDFVWPIIIISLGVWLIFGKHKYQRRRYYNHEPELNPADPNYYPETPLPASDLGNMASEPAYAYTADYTNRISNEDFLHATSILGGVKKIIVSKNFQGGDITNFMGGSEINLTQADIHGRVIIDITQLMGGTKLIVPSNWNVVSEMISIFAGLDDKRLIQPGNFNPEKVLIIRGTSIMGGVDIRSY